MEEKLKEVLKFGDYCLSGKYHFFCDHVSGGYWHQIENKRYTIEEVYEYWKKECAEKEKAIKGND